MVRPRLVPMTPAIAAYSTANKNYLRVWRVGAQGWWAGLPLLCAAWRNAIDDPDSPTPWVEWWQGRGV